jgi:hypothetical protein
LGKIFMERFGLGVAGAKDHRRAAICGEKRREEERRREEEKRLGRTSIGGREPALLAPYRVQRASSRLVLFVSMWHAYYSSWIARAPRWLVLVLRSIYGKGFPSDLFVKNVFKND